MKQLLAILILMGGFCATLAQTNPIALAMTNTTAPTLGVSNAPVNAKSAMPTNATLVVLDDEARTLLHKATEEPFIKTDTLVNAFLGAVLAVAVGLLADRQREKRDKARKEEEDNEFERNTALAIRREVESLGKIYDAGIGQQLKNTTTEVFPIRLAITQDWFTVFAANTSHLGKIDPEISRRIIATYALTKGLIEEFRINNDLLAQYEAGASVGWGTKLEGKFQVSLAWATHNEAQVKALLKAQLVRIRETEKQLNAATTELYAILDQHGMK